MKTILLYVIVIAAISWLLKDTPIADQVRTQIHAIQRHALQITSEKAANHASTQTSEPLYTTVDIFQNSREGIRTIPKGSLIHIISMSGDQITITNGITTLTTTPDSITHNAPTTPTTTHTPPQPPTPNIPTRPPAPPPEPPQNAQIRERIAEIDRKIQIIQKTPHRNNIQATRARREIDHLNLQRDNLSRMLR